MPFLALAASALILGQSNHAFVEVGTPIVQVGVFAYQPDGSVGARAVGTTPRLASVAWVTASACQLGAGGLPAEGTAAHAWRFSGKVLSSTAEEAVIQLEWQRTLDHSQAVGGPGTSVQLTLRVGEPAQLDFVSPTTTRCAATVAFEARYEPRGIRMHGKVDVSAAGGGSGGGTGAGAGGGTGQGSGKQSGPQSNTRTVTGTTAELARADSTPSATIRETFDVNVWLVHTAPGRDERVHHLAVRSKPEGGAAFMFPPVAVDIPQGQVTVQIGGSFTVENNGRDLVFNPSRIVMLKAAGGSNTVDRTRGEGKVSSPMPAADDVLSFELPPVATGVGPGIPDKFAIRAQIARR